MSLFPRFFNSCKGALSRSFKLAPYEINQSLLFASTVCHVNLCHSKSIKTQDKSGLQVIKVIKPKRVTSQQKKTSRLSSLRSKDEKRHSEINQLPGFHDEEFEFFEDRLASTISQYSSNITAYNAESKFTQSLVKEQAAVKRQTIKKRHFKTAPSPNLLTWAAKEQMRFLHRSNPEDWTIDSLTEHFPVSEESLKRILKTNRGILQEKDILKHDKEVLENWNNLHSKVESGQVSEEDFESFFKCFFNSQNECLVTNAVCQPNLPRPEPAKQQKKKGPLSEIVGDCLLLQEKETDIILKELIPSVSHSLSSKLEETALLFQKIALSFKRTNRNNSMSSLPNVSVNERKQNQSVDTLNNRSPDISEDLYGRNKSRNVRKHKPSLSGTYISNKTIYDENGEFLYKIP
ncbi:hypothetical protein EGW08_002010 [Elysia chlorotica]|uniref:Uncharacterized protein n=1 Tax=Elysia chlorotica TaxID=188477 RepID=A0A433U8U4_ELYCH|nr:hypothetical protein EGW08_002010 [Elysia chlorotica]